MLLAEDSDPDVYAVQWQYRKEYGARGTAPSARLLTRGRSSLLRLSAKGGSKAHIVCSIDCDPTGSYVVAAGTWKEIVVSGIESIAESDEVQATSQLGVAGDRPHRDRHEGPLQVTTNSVRLVTPSRLSSVRWVPGTCHVVAGDYDGTLTVWDLTEEKAILEGEEHSGKKIWSVACCRRNKGLIASASNDGTVCLWKSGSDCAVSRCIVPHGAAACDVAFCNSNEYLLGIGSNDGCVYVHDMRYGGGFVHILGTPGSYRAAAYAKFMGDSQIVSMHVDSSLKLWSLGPELCIPEPLREYRGHANNKQFVGLSVREDNVIACGSECGNVFTYYPAWSKPLASAAHTDRTRTRLRMGNEKRKYSALRQPPSEMACTPLATCVAWRDVDGKEPLLLGGGSDGAISMFSLLSNGDEEAWCQSL
mmetsp:Transcript_13540/g.49265  ORF Transcript_13540/g.49265 Transcript_13540/m.49265 type:complete len:419 (-) Transcript_13540:91-1347(-)